MALGDQQEPALSCTNDAGQLFETSEGLQGRLSSSVVSEIA